jgi:hypothetical protein
MVAGLVLGWTSLTVFGQGGRYQGTELSDSHLLLALGRYLGVSSEIGSSQQLH